MVRVSGWCVLTYHYVDQDVGDSRTGRGESVMTKAWLRCEVSPGMFSNERAIGVRTSDGSVVSFFIQNDKVSNEEIAVEVVDRNGEYGVVALPERTFEGSNVARVPMRSLR